MPVPPTRLQPTGQHIDPEGHRIKSQKLVYPVQATVSGQIPARFPPANKGLCGSSKQGAQRVLVQTALDPL